MNKFSQNKIKVLVDSFYQSEEPIVRFIDKDRVLILHKDGEYDILNKYYLNSKVFNTNKYQDRKYRFVLVIDSKLYSIFNLLKSLYIF